MSARPPSPSPRDDEEREEMRKVLVRATAGCDIQLLPEGVDLDGDTPTGQLGGWPCNTCFHALPLRTTAARQHELWEAVLEFRGDYPLVLPPAEREARLTELWMLLNAEAVG